MARTIASTGLRPELHARRRLRISAWMAHSDSIFADFFLLGLTKLAVNREDSLDLYELA
jgi:hypothetical protein